MNKLNKNGMPVYMNYVVISILTVMAVASVQMFDVFTNSIAASYGVITIAGISAAQQGMNTVLMLMGIVPSVAMMLIMTPYIIVKRFAKKKFVADIIYFVSAVIDIVVFYILCNALALDAKLFAADDEALAVAYVIMEKIKLYYIFAIPVFVLVSYYEICKIGVNRGLLFALVNLAIITLANVLKSMGTVAFGLEGMYSVVFPLVADIVMIGSAALVILVVWLIEKRKCSQN